MRLRDITVRSVTRDWLTQAGLSTDAAERKALELVEGAYYLHGEKRVSLDAPAVAFHVPGRIEVVGKHTDYAGGRSITLATEQSIVGVACPRVDSRVTIVDLDWSDVDIDPGQPLDTAVIDWSKYPRAVLAAVTRDVGTAPRGMAAFWSSDLPSAAGLSSSSAIVVATFLPLATLHGFAQTDAFRRFVTTPLELADYLAAAERGDALELGGAGTRGGSQDHAAILASQPGSLTQFAYHPTRIERTIDVDPSYSFVVGSSGVRAEKSGAAREAFNRLSRLSREAATALAHPGEGELSLGEIARDRGIELERTPPELRSRAEHFALESERHVPGFPSRVDAARTDLLAAVATASFRDGARLLGNQTPETIALTERATQLGAIAASPFGAGFGGSVWALVETARVSEFRSAWERDFREHHGTPDEPQFFATRPGPPALVLT